MKRNGQMQLRLHPLESGAYTSLTLTGAIPTPLPLPQLRRLLATLSFWSGWPVEVVLSVAAPTVGWCEVWVDLLAAVPERHLGCLRLVRERGDGR